MKKSNPDFSKINTFIFDVDGVLTDGTVFPYTDGEQSRSFNIKDGYAVEKALQNGYHVMVISGGKEEGVMKRLQFLGIKDIFLGVKNKLELFNDYKKDHHLDSSSILYMGDDIPDYKMLQHAGLPACPNDAVEDIKNICQYISPYNGGKGAVRDVIEKTMKSQGKWTIEKW
jgi:3-deoxy-D-manno-octulosonate 8-phosphate phosphatase (KDO 8-P phosphatase)